MGAKSLVVESSSQRARGRLAPRPAIDRSSYATSAGNLVGLMRGDAAPSLRSLPADTFNVVLTSPPYYWVRDYGFEGQLGHEETVEGYVANLMAVFDEVKRALH